MTWNQRAVRLFLVALFALACFSINACTKPGRTDTVESSTPSAPSSDQTSPATADQPSPAIQPANTEQPCCNSSSDADAEGNRLTPPTLSEAQAAVARIYQNTVVVDTTHVGSSFVVGDFNDDGSQDIAVIVKPARGMLQKINSEYANWTIEDVAGVALPVERNGVRVLPPRPEPVKVEPDDLLLVVVHGHQQNGWRNPQAQQTYLLKHGAGDNLRTEPLKDLIGDAANKSPHSQASGDVIKEKVSGQEGFIYWTGAKYAWLKEKQ